MAENVPQARRTSGLNIRNLILLLLVLLVFLFITGVVSPLALFDTILLRPMLNFLTLISGYLFNSFGLAIIVLTILIRVITWPLFMRQIRSTKAMQALAPKMKELQKKYAKDRDRLNQETIKLYKEYGVNPLGCAFPMLIQFPIWIGLYQAVIQGVGIAPENVVGLSKQLYSWAPIQEQVPLNSHFLWLDLASGDIFIAIMVAASMWALQKMSTMPTDDPTQQSTSRMMLWIMPLMFGFFALTLPSGLSLYWIFTNLLSMAVQYRVTGWGGLSIPSLASIRGGVIRPSGPTVVRGGAAKSVERGEGASTESDISEEGGEVITAEDVSSRRKRVRHGKHRDKRKVRRRSR
ncbi:MAG: membrane protein insertase YidC [Dehalococcoidia bacterium]|nr:MAG: membrane protein insertase YidC [Dehalococcoidia bacterium]